MRGAKFPEIEEMLIQDIQSIQWDQSLTRVKARPEEVQRDTKTHHIFLFKETKSGEILQRAFFPLNSQIFQRFLTPRILLT